MDHEKLVAKIFYKVNLINKSPLSIGASASSLTDHDCIRTTEKLFIPATSIAGALEAYAEKEGLNLFFVKETNDPEHRIGMSKFFISDGKFSENPKWRIRDGVKLNKDKQAEDTAKYDYQVIDKDSRWSFMIEITIREKQLESQASSLQELVEKYDLQVGQILSGIDGSYIRFGFKKTRGLGAVSIEKATRKAFYGDSLNNLIGFDFENGIDEPFIYQNNLTRSFMTIRCPVKLEGGVLIRGYSAKPDSPDFVQIDANGKACIPGSSLAGMIRHQMEKIIGSLNIKLPLEEMFGTIEKKDAHISHIIFDEAYLERDDGQGGFCQNSRVAIDSFSGGGLNGALYTEKVWYYGRTEICIHIERNKVSTELIGVLLLALEDFCKGYCAIGGETSIGNGIFSGAEILIDDKPFDLKNGVNLTALGNLYEKGGY
jgi:CRISPR/Cas system CSM-associated protein Csm3 (group 7 of RAMP superfamily)